MESVSELKPARIHFPRLKQNGESLAHSREEDDVGDEAPRHLQEGRRSEEGHPGGEEDVQALFVSWTQGAQDSPQEPQVHVLSNH